MDLEIGRFHHLGTVCICVQGLKNRNLQMKSLQIHQKNHINNFLQPLQYAENEYFAAKSSSIAQYIMDWSVKGVLCV